MIIMLELRKSGSVCITSKVVSMGRKSLRMSRTGEDSDVSNYLYEPRSAGVGFEAEQRKQR